MKKIYTYLFLLGSMIGFSQTEKDSLQPTALEEVTISIKLPTNLAFLPNQVIAITEKQIDFQNFQSTAEMLSNSGSLFVQKSQQGGGSPVIRGFEASRVLLLVDGVRMNNLIFRSGHLQNVITVDESFLDNVGVFYGPTSTLFGSDALGGTVTMTTKKAAYLNEAKNQFTGKINTRYSTANEEKSMAFQLNYATANLASLTAFSYNDFGDLKMGKRKNHNGDFFGERPFYVANINGVDQLIPNGDKYVQKNSGYKQYNLMQKLGYKTQSGVEHGLNFQFSTSTDIPRYDRLTQTSSSTVLTHAEWYYGPQQRVLGVYSIAKNNAFLSSDLKVNVAFQNAKESRHNRRFGNYVLQNREENVNMYSVSTDLKKKFTKSELFYGFESYFETLNSTAYSNNTTTGLENSISTRYPNGDNSMVRNDVYVSYNEKISNNTFWNTGARLGYTNLKSSIDDDQFFPLPFSTISQGNFTYSGTIGIVRATSENFTLKANVASGFRVPNIDDLAKIFESVQGTIIVPNEDLKPEKTVTADFGFVIQSKSQKTKFETTYFYTRMYDALVVDEFLYNGQSVIDYDGTPSTVFANQNKGKAFVTGISSSFSASLSSHVLFNANFNYNLGRVVEEGRQSPLDHISPFFGKIGLAYNGSKLNLEAYLLYNGKKDSNEYSSSGEDNQQYAPIGGMPAWETYNFKLGYLMFKGATLFAGIENILDTQYRTFASGINAPGRNLYGGLQYAF